MREEDRVRAHRIISEEFTKNTHLMSHDLSSASQVYNADSGVAVCPACNCEFLTQEFGTCPDCGLSFGG